MRIVFTGGGTGGHLFPLIAVAKEIKNQHEILYIGPDDFAKEILIKENFPCRFIFSGKWRRYFSVLNFIDILKIFLGVIQSFWILWFWMPDAIFSKGGYGSFPVVFVGWFYHIPILIHESDAMPGVTNKIAAHFAKRIAVSFLKTKEYFPPDKTALIGNPVRKEIFAENKEEARKTFNISSEKPVLLIMGGSQGSKIINDIVLKVLPELTEKCEVIHISGAKDYEFISANLAKILKTEEIVNYDPKIYYHLYPFLDENTLKYAYLLTDVIVSRAGAGSIFEIASVGKPSILIPLEMSASDHQKNNAFEYAKNGGTIVLEEPNLTPHLFLEKIFYLVDNQELRQKMSEGAKSFAKLDASEKIAEELLKLGQR